MHRIGIVGLGGLLGAISRYLVTGWFQGLLGSAFPWGTAVVNIVGGFLAGLVITLATESLVFSTNARLFLAVGVLGGFTTFSSFGYETMRLAESGSYAYALGNVLLNVVVGFLAVFLGIVIARLF